VDRAFDCPPAGAGDPDPSGLDRSAARGFGPHRREPIFHKVEQFGREPRKEQQIGAAALSCVG
jgi:hypothetical protein